MGPPPPEVGVRVDLDRDIQVARRPAIPADIPPARHSHPGPGIHSGRNLNIDLSRLLSDTLAPTVPAILAPADTRSLAGGAGRGEFHGAALQMGAAAPPAGWAAAFPRGVDVAAPLAGRAAHQSHQLGSGLQAVDRLLEPDLH